MEFKIRYDKKACIGAGVCAVFSKKHWFINGKADLINSVKISEHIFEKKISDQDLAETKLAAEGCPRNCIKIFTESGEEVELNR